MTPSCRSNHKLSSNKIVTQASDVKKNISGSTTLPLMVLKAISLPVPKYLCAIALCNEKVDPSSFFSVGCRAFQKALIAKITCEHLEGGCLGLDKKFQNVIF